MFRREPARRVHPDPAIEAELQRILSLRAMAARKDAELARCARRLRRAERGSVRGSMARIERERTAAELRRQISALEGEVLGLHDEIAARIGKIDRDDLLWLDG